MKTFIEFEDATCDEVVIATLGACRRGQTRIEVPVALVTEFFQMLLNDELEKFCYPDGDPSHRIASIGSNDD